MVRLEIEKVEAKKARLAPKIFRELDIYEGDILSITEPNTEKKIVALASKHNGTSEKRVGLGKDHIKSLGVDEGFRVEITPYREGLVPVREVKLGIAPASSKAVRAEDRMLSIKKNEKELLQFLGDRVFTINSKFEWDRYDVVVSIEETVPELRADDVARFGELENFKYEWVGKEVKTFNGILFIDVSGSMEREDMMCQGIDWAIDRMKQEFTDPEAQKFFEEVQGKRRLSRLNGSLLAALKYLVEKIGRGVGEKIAVMLYTTNAHVVTFDGNQYYNSSQPHDRVANTILKRAKDIHHGKTNLLDALKQARDISKDFPINKMKMFVILTDGEVDHEKESLDFLQKHIYPRGDIVVNTLGIGDEINEDFLATVANNSGGQYHHIRDLKELVEKYSEYAMNLEIQGKEESIVSWKRSLGSESGQVKETSEYYAKPKCPHCGTGLVYSDNDWYCYGCQVYVGSEIEVRNVPSCERCENFLSYIEDENSWYCYECEEWVDI